MVKDLRMEGSGQEALREWSRWVRGKAEQKPER